MLLKSGVVANYPTLLPLDLCNHRNNLCPTSPVAYSRSVDFMLYFFVYRLLKNHETKNQAQVFMTKISYPRTKIKCKGKDKSLGTPQQNSVVESKIPTLVGIARAMLIEATLKKTENLFVRSFLQHQIWII